MKNFFGGLCASLLAAAVLLASPAFAATPVQGSAAGGNYVTVKVDKAGSLVGVGGDVANDFTAQFSLTDTTVTNFKAAPGASFIACLDWVNVSGIAATTAVTLTVKRASTTVFVFNVPAAVSNKDYTFPRGVCGAANQALTATLSGAPTGAVQVNAHGYVKPN